MENEDKNHVAEEEVAVSQRRVSRSEGRVVEQPDDNLDENRDNEVSKPSHAEEEEEEGERESRENCHASIGRGVEGVAEKARRDVGVGGAGSQMPRREEQQEEVLEEQLGEIETVPIEEELEEEELEEQEGECTDIPIDYGRLAREAAEHIRRPQLVWLSVFFAVGFLTAAAVFLLFSPFTSGSQKVCDIPALQLEPSTSMESVESPTRHDENQKAFETLEHIHAQKRWDLVKIDNETRKKMTEFEVRGHEDALFSDWIPVGDLSKEFVVHVEAQSRGHSKSKIFVGFDAGDENQRSIHAMRRQRREGTEVTFSSYDPKENSLSVVFEGRETLSKFEKEKYWDRYVGIYLDGDTDRLPDEVVKFADIDSVKGKIYLTSPILANLDLREGRTILMNHYSVGYYQYVATDNREVSQEEFETFKATFGGGAGWNPQPHEFPIGTKWIRLVILPNFASRTVDDKTGEHLSDVENVSDQILAIRRAHIREKLPSAMLLDGPVLTVSRADVVGKTFHFHWAGKKGRKLIPQADQTMIQIGSSPHPNEGRWTIENGDFCTVNSETKKIVARYEFSFRSGGKLIMISLKGNPRHLVED